MRKVICAAIRKEGKILLVKKKETWILPGGKPKRKEPDKQCLIREFSEELPLTKLKNIKFYRTVKGQTPHRKDMIESKVYFADLTGETYPYAEIKAAVWTKNPEKFNLSEITRKIIEDLLSE